MVSENPFKLSRTERQPAAAGKPVIDPAGWYPEDVAACEDWRYVLSREEIAEIDAAVQSVRERGMDIVDITKEDFPLPKVSAALGQIREQLQNGFGFTQIRGMPVEKWSKAEAAAAFYGLGVHLGRPLSQNGGGDMLGHIKDLGGDYSDPKTRGYLTNARMGFHADQCDYVVLFCLQQAKTGGSSRIASSVTVYNEILNQTPELLPELTAPSHWSLHGEINPGEKPWYDLSVFNFEDGYFSAKGVSSHIMKSQAIPEVPRYSEKRLEAFDKYRETAVAVSTTVDVIPGDINFLHNHVVLHSRDAFEDWPEPERKRHLYRLWLNDDEHARPIPQVFRDNIQGLWVEGVKPHADIDVGAA